MRQLQQQDERRVYYRLLCTIQQSIRHQSVACSLPLSPSLYLSLAHHDGCAFCLQYPIALLCDTFCALLPHCLWLVRCAWYIPHLVSILYRIMCHTIIPGMYIMYNINVQPLDKIFQVVVSEYSCFIPGVYHTEKSSISQVMVVML